MIANPRMLLPRVGLWLLSLGCVLQVFCSLGVQSAFCSYPSKSKYTDLSSPIQKVMADMPLAAWYTDRDQSSLSSIKDVIGNCGDSEPLIVVYGLPNKDCAAGESSSGSNRNAADYKSFVSKLKDAIGNRQASIILEPDAIALSIDGCGGGLGYLDNMKEAANILQSPNIKLYADVGFWMLNGNKVDAVSKVLSTLNVRGVSLNLSNYRSTAECRSHCGALRSVSGKDYKCIIDTSRNHKGPDANGEWCNYKGAGIGQQTTTADGFIDAMVWVKPAIELDGNCYGRSNSYQSSLGAGARDQAWLEILWNNGFYKDRVSTAAPTNTPPANTPTTWVTPAPAAIGSTGASGPWHMCRLL